MANAQEQNLASLIISIIILIIVIVLIIIVCCSYNNGNNYNQPPRPGLAVAAAYQYGMNGGLNKNNFISIDHGISGTCNNPKNNINYCMTDGGNAGQCMSGICATLNRNLLHDINN